MVLLSDAPGGTAQTFISKGMQSFLAPRNKTSISVETSTVAGQRFREGQASHSTLKMPILLNVSHSCDVLGENEL